MQWYTASQEEAPTDTKEETMAKFKHFPDFDKHHMAKHEVEEINNLIVKAVMGTIWDNTKYCSMTWDLRVNLQEWED